MDIKTDKRPKIYHPLYPDDGDGVLRHKNNLVCHSPLDLAISSRGMETYWRTFHLFSRVPKSFL